MNVIGSFKFDFRILPVLPFLLIAGLAIALAAIPILVFDRARLAMPLAAVFSAGLAAAISGYSLMTREFISPRWIYRALMDEHLELEK